MSRIGIGLTRIGMDCPGLEVIGKYVFWGGWNIGRRIGTRWALDWHGLAKDWKIGELVVTGLGRDWHWSPLNKHADENCFYECGPIRPPSRPMSNLHRSLFNRLVTQLSSKCLGLAWLLPMHANARPMLCQFYCSWYLNCHSDLPLAVALLDDGPDWPRFTSIGRLVLDWHGFAWIDTRLVSEWQL